MKSEYKTLIFSSLFGACLTMILTLIPIWQLMIISPILTGMLNQRMRYSIIAGINSILLSWIIYITIRLALGNVYGILDLLGSLIFEAGYAWIFLLIIFLSGVIFGALGGCLGSKLKNLIVYLRDKKERNSI